LDKKGPIIQVRSLRMDFTGKIAPIAVLENIDLEVFRGEFVCIVGPSGCGKSTLLNIVAGFFKPTSGEVLVNGTQVSGPDPHRIFVFQENGVFPWLTVEQNILAILETLPLSKAERKNRCEQLLHQFGIERIAKNIALTLSGGEKRRLTIARSLVTKPKLLMLDEPFSGVDPIAVYDVQQIIVNLRKSGLAIMITDHNVRETLSIVDRAYLIYEGRVESEGTKDFLINDPISRQLYLGERFKM